MTDWIKWDGGECPVAEGAFAECRRRDGEILPVMAMPSWNWKHEHNSWDIVAYRVVDVPGASTGAVIELERAVSAAVDRAKASALSAHPGGTHYSDAPIPPAQFITANSLQFLEGCIVKRAFRHDKPTGKGREDVEKIIHEAQLLLELKYGVAA